ncbi:hypothetical protein [Pantanalinema sp. GBBB05]|uniref:hypothetical protein n=1 Tax=Pantanalinema sp. GBBB05 TaxID=2604139 RepID=UPI001DC73F16|nr:hypothetical protein [Pantanalinema sp. GBBB05]
MFTKLNKILIETITGSWLAFILVGWLISRLLTSPDLVILIDRAYCPAIQWQQLSQSYQQIYQQHQQHQVQIKAVIVFSDLSEEAFSTPPSPDMIRSLQPYGRVNTQRQSQLQAAYQNTTLLACQPITSSSQF